MSSHIGIVVIKAEMKEYRLDSR